MISEGVKVNSLNVRTQIWRRSLTFRKKHGMEWEEKEEKLPTRLNPFVLNAPFLYPLKTSENRKVKGEASYVFQKIEE